MAGSARYLEVLLRAPHCIAEESLKAICSDSSECSHLATSLIFLSKAVRTCSSALSPSNPHVRGRCAVPSVAGNQDFGCKKSHHRTHQPRWRTAWRTEGAAQQFTGRHDESRVKVLLAWQATVNCVDPLTVPFMAYPVKRCTSRDLLLHTSHRIQPSTRQEALLMRLARLRRCQPNCLRVHSSGQRDVSEVVPLITRDLAVIFLNTCAGLSQHQVLQGVDVLQYAVLGKPFA